MSNKVKILAIIIAVVIPGGFILAYGISKFIKICYSIISYDIKLDSQNIHLNLKLRVKNPSFLSIIINGYLMDIVLNGSRVGKVENFSPKTLEAGQASILTIPVKIDISKTFNTVFSSELLTYFGTKKYDKIIIEIKGRFVGKILKMPVTVPVDLKYSLKEIEQTMKEPSKPC